MLARLDQRRLPGKDVDLLAGDEIVDLDATALDGDAGSVPEHAHREMRPLHDRREERCLDGEMRGALVGHVELDLAEALQHRGHCRPVLGHGDGAVRRHDHLIAAMDEERASARVGDQHRPALQNHAVGERHRLHWSRLDDDVSAQLRDGPLRRAGNSRRSKHSCKD